MNLSEHKKEDYPCGIYKAKQNGLFDEMQLLWNVKPTFAGSCISDYKLIQNELVDRKTSWRDKYTTVVYSPNPNISCKRWELQPLPDYMRWLKTSELHYLPYEERAALKQGPWDETPGIFLPTCVLDLCYSLVEDPSPHLMNMIALLAWTTVSETKQYYDKLKKRMEDTIKSDEEKER